MRGLTMVRNALLSVILLFFGTMMGYAGAAKLLSLQRTYSYYATTPPSPPGGCQGLSGGAYIDCMVRAMGDETLSALFLAGIGLFFILFVRLFVHAVSL